MYLVIIILGGNTGVCTKGFGFAKQMLYHLSCASSPEKCINGAITAGYVY
jgi:hypothetical protein